ncbi:MAG: FAD-dependent oxidoreductase [Spirochaetaceae bacterium]|nr:MAG: FAD-dependent oxidoreductase [Spirochaetaceae bacterium]
MSTAAARRSAPSAEGSGFAAMGEAFDVLIVGAGMSGLTAARGLAATGRSVRVVDKGRGVGGRVATRRISDATFDHGAQFFTARDPRFLALVEQWVAEGAASEWFRSSSGSGGNPRYRGTPTMTSIAKALSAGLDVVLSTRVESVRRVGDTDRAAWRVRFADATEVEAGSVILTPPVPQSLEILRSGEVVIESQTRSLLESVEYAPCIAIMAVLNGPSRIDPPGGIAPKPDDPAFPISWISDNRQKGVSNVAAITIHASAAFSRENLQRDPKDVADALLSAASPWLGSDAIEHQLHVWRYARPTRFLDVGCVTVCASPALVVAGDACLGARLEAAVLSGWAAASVCTTSL